jgi:hypothetical protein
VQSVLDSNKTVYIVNALVVILAIISITDPALFGLNPAHVAWVAAVLNILLRFLTKGPGAIMLASLGAKPKE